MAATTFLTFPLDEGKKLVEALEDRSFDFKAAFWLYEPESDNWHLVIATPLVTTVGPAVAYEKVQDVLGGMVPALDNIKLHQIKVVEPTDELVKALRAEMQIGRNDNGRLRHRGTVGGHFAEEMYVYRSL